MHIRLAPRWCFMGVIAIVLLASRSHAGQLSDVLRNPRAYDHKEVALIGVARVEGDSFVLYEDPVAASKLDGSKGIYVEQKRGGPDYDRFDREWVKLIGIVDAEKRSVSVERVEAVPARPRPEIKDVTTYGVFQNETPNEVQITLLNETGREYGELSIGPNESNRSAIYKGTAIATTLAGAEVARGAITPPDLSPSEQYLPRDSDKRIVYYRVRSGKIEAVASGGKASNR